MKYNFFIILGLICIGLVSASEPLISYTSICDNGSAIFNTTKSAFSGAPCMNIRVCNINGTCSNYTNEITTANGWVQLGGSLGFGCGGEPKNYQIQKLYVFQNNTIQINFSSWNSGEWKFKSYPSSGLCNSNNCDLRIEYSYSNSALHLTDYVNLTNVYTGCPIPFITLDTEIVNNTYQAIYYPNNVLSSQSYNCNATAWNDFSSSLKSGINKNSTTNYTVNFIKSVDIIETKFVYLESICKLSNGSDLDIKCFDDNSELCYYDYWVDNGAPQTILTNIYGVRYTLTPKPETAYAYEPITGFSFQVRDSLSGTVLTGYQSAYYNLSLPNGCAMKNDSIQKLVTNLTIDEQTGIYTINFFSPLICSTNTIVPITLKVSESPYGAYYNYVANEIMYLDVFNPKYTFDNVNAFWETNGTISLLTTISHGFTRTPLNIYTTYYKNENYNCNITINGTIYNQAYIYPVFGSGATLLYTDWVFHTNKISTAQIINAPITINCKNSYDNRTINSTVYVDRVSVNATLGFQCKLTNGEISAIYSSNVLGYQQTNPTDITCSIMLSEANNINFNCGDSVGNNLLEAKCLLANMKLNKYNELFGSLPLNSDWVEFNNSPASIWGAPYSIHSTTNSIVLYPANGKIFDSYSVSATNQFNFYQNNLTNTLIYWNLPGEDFHNYYSTASLDIKLIKQKSVELNGAFLRIINKSNSNSSRPNKIEINDSVVCYGSASGFYTNNIDVEFRIRTGSGTNLSYCNSADNEPIISVVNNSLGLPYNLYNFSYYIDNIGSSENCNSTSFINNMKDGSNLLCDFIVKYTDENQQPYKIPSKQASIPMYYYSNETPIQNPNDCSIYPDKCAKNYVEEWFAFFFGSTYGILMFAFICVIFVVFAIPIWALVILPIFNAIFGGR